MSTVAGPEANSNATNISPAANAQVTAKEFIDEGRLLSEAELCQLTPEQQIAYACGTQIVASFVPVKTKEQST